MSKFEKLCNEYRENKRLIEEIEAMQDGIKAEIIEIMNGADTMTDGASKATYKNVTSARFDSTSFKKVYPDLFNQYNKTSTYKRFTVV